MAEKPRPLLKLKVGGGAAASSPSATSRPASPPPTSSATPKLKIRFSSSSIPKTEDSPSFPVPKIKLKQPKKGKPSNLSTTKKRDHDAISEGDHEGSFKSGPKSSTIKKIKLNTTRKTPTTPFIKLKGRGKPPVRPQGAAYDSEASDREVDPAIEEEFVLRMMPGDDCEYVRKAVEEKRWGGRADKGADIRLKFLQYDGRRAILTIRNKIYAAALVDMPCLVEGMKSWDRRAWYKAADICQMLLVLGVVNSEAEALEYPLPLGDVDKATMQYAHGLTPPMRWVRKRRFKKRVSTRTIEAVEEEVERLLRLDTEAVGKAKYELVDLDRLSKGPSGRGDSAQPESEYEEVDMDANGEVVLADDYFTQEVEEDEDALAAQFELAMQEEDGEGGAETPAASSSAAPDTQIVTDSEIATPAPGTASKDDSGDEESDEDEDLAELDEDVLEQRADMQRQREEIADLEAVIKEQIAEMESTQNNILKGRRLQKIQSLKADLELKKRAIGEGEDDE